MIDHLLAFVDEVAAHADPVVGKYWTPGTRGNPPAWDPNCIPDIFLWDPADDTTETVPGPDGDHETIVHHPHDDQWRVLIALDEAGFVGHSALDIVANRDTSEVMYSRLPDELRLQPIFAGSDYPFTQPAVQSDAPKSKKRRK